MSDNEEHVTTDDNEDFSEEEQRNLSDNLQQGSEAAEEEEEDEDVEEEEDEKRKKAAASMFIEEEAAVDDDDEEDFYEDEDDYAGEEEEVDQDQRDKSYLDDAVHRQYDRQRQDREDVDANELAGRLEEKYKRRDYGRNFEEGLQEGDQRLLIPSVSDPKLWLVKCKPGREREICLNLMRKYFELLTSPQPLLILSAFTRDSLKGYIYIEAQKQSFVQQAIEKMLNVYGQRLQLVPVNEMVDCLLIKKKDVQFNVGSWIRVKRGKYEGDLGQLVEVYDTADVVKVKLVPRIDFQQQFTGDRKRKKQMRPPQKLFHPDLIADKRSMQSVAGGYIQYSNEVYDKKGFLEKTFKVTALNFEGIQPSLEEITRFSSGKLAEEGQELLSLAQAKTATADDFQIGETVQVIDGALVNLVGTVQSIEKEIITIQPSGDFGLEKSLQFPVAQLRKKFQTGEHVHVQHGVHKDETGMILNVEDNVVTLLSDSQMKPIQVFLKDLMRGTDSTKIAVSTSQMQFDVHDMVQLNPNEVGVVIKLEKDLLHILNQHGTLVKVKPQQAQLRKDARSSANAVSQDSQGNSFSVGDILQVSDPSRADANRRGTVLHIFKLFVFLHSREITENNGVFVTRSANLSITSAKTRSGVTHANASAMRYPHPSSMQGGFSAGFNRRDPLLSKTVTITFGPYKGYIGVLKNVIDGVARVELHTNAKTVSVGRDYVNAPGDSSGRSGPRPNRGFDGGKTPMYSGSKTPMHSSGRTPMYRNEGNSSSYRDGGRTPAWNSSSRTPSYNPGGRTPAWDSGSRTPAWQASSGHRTPAWQASTSTPNPYASGANKQSSGGDYDSGWGNFDKSYGTGNSGPHDSKNTDRAQNDGWGSSATNRSSTGGWDSVTTDRPMDNAASGGWGSGDSGWNTSQSNINSNQNQNQQASGEWGNTSDTRTDSGTKATNSSTGGWDQNAGW